MKITEDQVRTIVIGTTGIPADSDSSADLYLELGVASFAALQLLMDLEEQLNVKIPDEEFVQSSSIAKLTHMLNNLDSNPKD